MAKGSEEEILSVSNFKVKFENVDDQSFDTISGLGIDFEDIHVAPDDWRRYRRSLDRLDVWSWDQHYATPDVMDGTWAPPICTDRQYGGCST